MQEEENKKRRPAITRYRVSGGSVSGRMIPHPHVLDACESRRRAGRGRDGAKGGEKKFIAANSLES